MFVNENGKSPNMDHLADQLRDDLGKARVTRIELFEAHGNWGRFNVHSLRHSYVTRMLASGASEDAIRLRTGHKSNELLRYREQARSIAELELGTLSPMHESVPELARMGQSVGQSLGQPEKRAPEGERRRQRKAGGTSRPCARGGTRTPTPCGAGT